MITTILLLISTLPGVFSAAYLAGSFFMKTLIPTFEINHTAIGYSILGSICWFAFCALLSTTIDLIKEIIKRRYDD